MVSINDPMDRILKERDSVADYRPTDVSINDPMDRILKGLHCVTWLALTKTVSINDPMDRILKAPADADAPRMVLRVSINDPMDRILKDVWGVKSAVSDCSFNQRSDG